jgi:hypothetical protein
VRTAVVGAQAPRIHHVPPYVSSAGQQAIEIAEIAGLYLDPWEKLVIGDALGETADGRWAAYRVGLEVPRQNGKGSVLEARELAGLFALGERLIIHSAHEQATASEHFRRILMLMEGVPEFDRRILKVVRGKGLESIELRDGHRIFFKTRTGGGGRGFTGDLVVFDEAMILAAAFMAALVPTMAARSMVGDPQLWFAGSAVDQQKTEHGVEFSRVRADALAGVERWRTSAGTSPYDNPDDVPDEVLDDPEAWGQANPGLGIRIAPQYIADERRALGRREFAVERSASVTGQHPTVPTRSSTPTTGTPSPTTLRSRPARSVSRLTCRRTVRAPRSASRGAARTESITSRSSSMSAAPRGSCAGWSSSSTLTRRSRWSAMRAARPGRW